jgi:chloramphenicol-sensitive protein RarD
MTPPTVPADAKIEFRKGLTSAVFAFIAWGLFPLYWRLLVQVPPLQITAHRVVWCAVFVAGWLTFKNGPGWVRATLARPRAAPMLLASSLLISCNWVLYIWAVNSGHVVESALGYFINPLVNVLLGVAVLKERLNVRQWIAVALAAGGVAYLTWKLGQVPWIALSLAASFGTYGLIRKLVTVESVPGLGIESLFVFFPALAYLVWCQAQGSGGFGSIGRFEDALMVFAGIATAFPLIWFAYGARRIPLSLVGIIQYLGPTLQLLTGVFVFGEAFTSTQLIGFSCIWAALGLYALDGLWRIRIRGYG